MHGIRHAVHNVFKGAVEAVTPVPTVSTFEKDRKITPDEFVKAGDYLTGLSRAWVWEGGEATKRVSYLPADKQYLVTKGVPCHQRAVEVEGYGQQSDVAAEGDEWVCTPSVKPQADAAEIPDLAGEPEKADGTEEPKEGEGEDEIPDIDDAEVDEATFNPAEQAAELVDAEAETVRTRTYDLYITYDKFYLTPRFWLVGFDELGRPLPFDKMLEDISEEHARKTITRDPHPHLSMSCAYIHPCKHAHTMKRLGDNLLEQGRGFPVDHYMVVFLKFIASIIPTIEYDYTMSI